MWRQGSGAIVSTGAVDVGVGSRMVNGIGTVPRRQRCVAKGVTEVDEVAAVVLPPLEVA
jgi:hypothetical protein